MPELTIVVPVYNEYNAVESTVQAFEEDLRDVDFTWKVLFVDDGSHDGSGDKLEELGQEVIRHEKNKGYGAALKTGIRAADSPYICIIDCDGTYPPSEIPRLMKLREKAPMIVGERDVTKAPTLPRVAKTFAIHLASRLFEQPMRDINSGLRIFETKTLQKYVEGCGEKFSFTSGITLGYLLDSVPIHYEPIEYLQRIGETKLKVFRFIGSFCDSLTRMRTHVRKLQEEEGRAPKDPSNLEHLIPAPMLTALVFLIGVLVATFFVWPKIVNPYIVEEDSFQHTWWTATFHDPELFQNSFYLPYAKSLSTPGLSALYWVGTYFTTPYAFGNILTILLYGITGMFIFLAVRNVVAPSIALMVALLFYVHGGQISPMQGGLHRAFAMPTLAWFLYIITAERYRQFGWSLGVQFLFYPIAALISLGYAGLAAFFRLINLKRMMSDRWFWASMLIFIVCVITTVQMKKANTPDDLGPKVTGAEMMESRAFMEDAGRHEYFPIPSTRDFIWEFGFRDSTLMAIYVILFPFSLIFAWLRGFRVERLLGILASVFFSSIILFILSQILFFKLYIPDRYMEYSMPLVISIMAGIGAAVPLYFVRTPAMKVVLVLLIAGYSLFNFRAEIPSYEFKYSDELFAFLKSTPKDTLIASDPNFADQAGGLSFRSTYVKFELAHCWYKDFWAENDRRALELYKALYATDFDDVLAFMEKEGVDYLVVRKKYIQPEGFGEYSLYFSPLEWEILAIGRENMAKGLALADRSNEELAKRIVHEDELVFIVAKDLPEAE